jgi:hypothetical protein
MIDAREDGRRLATVRDAKRAKVESGGSPDLTPAELDAILPPIDEQVRMRELTRSHKRKEHIHD